MVDAGHQYAMDTSETEKKKKKRDDGVIKLLLINEHSSNMKY